jgi:two-component system, LytTR family, response regulator
MSDFIMISNQHESYPIEVLSIIRLEACEGKTFIVTDDLRQHVFSYNLGEAEKLLGTNFYRCHNSHIINPKHIRQVRRGRIYFITLSCKTVVPVAARNVAEFRRRFFQ